MISRFLDGLTTPAEECQLRKELEARPSLTFDERAVLDLLRLPFPKEDTKTLLKANDTSLSLPSRGVVFNMKRAFLAVAACALLLLLLHYSHHRVEPERQPVVVQQTTTQQDGIESEEKKEPQPLITQETPIVVKAETKRPVKSPKSHSKKTIPESTKEPEFAMSAEGQEVVPIEMTVIRAIHITPDVVMYVRDASNQLPAAELPSVSELRARGARLTNDVQQHIHQASIQY